MYRKDFIMRMIEEVATVLAKALGLKEKGEYSEALEEINHAYDELLKINNQEVHHLSCKEILMKFDEDQVEKAEVLAKFLKLEGEIYLEQNNLILAKEYLTKSLELYKYADEHSDVFSFERKGTISEIENNLEKLI